MSLVKIISTRSGKTFTLFESQIDGLTEHLAIVGRKLEPWKEGYYLLF